MDGHPCVVFGKTKCFMKKPSWEGGTLPKWGSGHKEYRGSVFLKTTHNLVFAGQPYSTTTLLQNGHGAFRKLVCASARFASKLLDGVRVP